LQLLEQGGVVGQIVWRQKCLPFNTGPTSP
jgi:hypothetical protein